MQPFMDQTLELEADAAHVIAAAMREVAAADGVHEREQELISAFTADLPPADGAEALSALRTPAHREALLKSLALVAFADGAVSEAERTVIRRYAGLVGIDDIGLTRIFTDVASALLSTFSGVEMYRDQVEAIGQSMGLDPEAIQEVLD